LKRNLAKEADGVVLMMFLPVKVEMRLGIGY
jgi:hypothetical protein